MAEVQDKSVENEITERVRVTTPMMLSRMSGAEEEMSASFQKELHRTLIDEGGEQQAQKKQPMRSSEEIQVQR